MSRELVEAVAAKYGDVSSFALWGPVGDRPKSGMDNIDVIYQRAHEAHARVVLVGLNVSAGIETPLSNFHGENGLVYKLRAAATGTKAEGGYITDILKHWVEADSGKVKDVLRDKPELLAPQFEAFRSELEFVGADKGTILVAMGGLVEDLLHECQTGLAVIKVPHYAARGTNEEYITTFRTALEKAGLV